MRMDISGDLITSFQCGGSYSPFLNTYLCLHTHSLSKVDKLLVKFLGHWEAPLRQADGSSFPPIMHHHKILLACLWYCVLYSYLTCVLPYWSTQYCVCIHSVLIDVWMGPEVFIGVAKVTNQCWYASSKHTKGHHHEVYFWYTCWNMGRQLMTAPSLVQRRNAPAHFRCNE